MARKLTKMTQLDAVRSWLQQAVAGSAILYHTGDLASQRGLDPELDARALLLYNAATIYGSVELTQRRVSYGVTQYVATKRSNSR